MIKVHFIFWVLLRVTSRKKGIPTAVRCVTSCPISIMDRVIKKRRTTEDNTTSNGAKTYVIAVIKSLPLYSRIK